MGEKDVAGSRHIWAFLYPLAKSHRASRAPSLKFLIESRKKKKRPVHVSYNPPPAWGGQHIHPGVSFGGEEVIPDSEHPPLGPCMWIHGPHVWAIAPGELGADSPAFGGIPRAQQLWIKMF